MTIPKHILNDITYSVEANVAIVKFNRPAKYNAFAYDHYRLLISLVERAEAEPNTIATIFTGSGKFFSAGADVQQSRPSTGSNDEFDRDEVSELVKKTFVGNNALLVDVLQRHSKILVAALNGPAIGLSASLVLLCDLIYARDLKSVYLLLPFANLGLVAEGAASVTLFHKLGVSRANEALLLSKRISGSVLQQAGLLNKVFNITDIIKFNDAVVKEVNDSVEGLSFDSVKQIKHLVKANWDHQISANNASEVAAGYRRFLTGIPQQRFSLISKGKLRHKL